MQVVQVMGLENDIDVTDDIEAANAVLASNSELKQNPWIRGVAKFHHLPIFVIKVHHWYAQLVSIYAHDPISLSCCILLPKICRQILWHKWLRQYV